VATNFMTIAYDDFGGAEHIPGGRTAPEFTRWCLDRLGVCEKMQRAKFSGKLYILPQSTLPGAAPEARANRPGPPAEYTPGQGHASRSGGAQAHATEGAAG
jgi:hypothetical protein